ncbi:MAG: hypothetical protein QNJ78_00500 [Gammaproteobacteria bacterium]|nr:hypothetical protein [Gammaproteobacteria bacterium]
MQLDMHYYGTFALAYAAGLNKQTAGIIATAAQFVDDNAAAMNIEFQDGGRVDAEATAHHVAELCNLDKEDQRQVWVPFHFLPGNEGTTYSERLLCRKNSAIAKEMVRHHLGYAKSEMGPHLIGITAHVYGDTFAHHGFSGVGSRRNKVDNDSFWFDGGLDPDIRDYIEGKAEDFFIRFGKGGGLFANLKSWLAETISGALGHGAVATYPDRPYLIWGFDYEYPKKRQEIRNNPRDFMEGCLALHSMFKKFAGKNPQLTTGNGMTFNSIRPEVKKIIGFQGKKEERIKQWLSAARRGKLSPRGYEIPRYAPENWLFESAEMDNSKDSEVALDSNLYRFYQAASMHRYYVLRELLPKHDLVVA